MRFSDAMDKRTISWSGCASAIFRYVESERMKDKKLREDAWSKKSRPTQADVSCSINLTEEREPKLPAGARGPTLFLRVAQQKLSA